MNEILKKRIEEAAGKRSFKYLSQDRIEELDLECHYEAGFIDGAEYALSHQWISVEDALPDGVQDVLVSASDGSVDIAHYFAPTSTWWAKDGNIVAPKCWMPIPGGALTELAKNNLKEAANVKEPF